MLLVFHIDGLMCHTYLGRDNWRSFFFFYVRTRHPRVSTWGDSRAKDVQTHDSELNNRGAKLCSVLLAALRSSSCSPHSAAPPPCFLPSMASLSLKPPRAPFPHLPLLSPMLYFILSKCVLRIYSLKAVGVMT